MKKRISMIMAICLLLSLTACGVNSGTNSNTEPSATQSQAETPSSEPTEDPGVSSDDPAEGSDPAAEPTEEAAKTLVVYFSATGTTQGVAQTIADTVGADLFEVVPSDPYTSDDLNWTNNDSRVSREHNDEGLRAVALESTDVDGWDDYDTVFIGYPIWWAIAAWPVNNFVKNNDFTGKTVIPFAASSSSGMGQSGTLLEEMANGGTWQSGQRFSSGVSSSTVRDWAAGLGL